MFIDSTEYTTEPKEVWAIFIQFERVGMYEAKYMYGEGFLVTAVDEHCVNFRRIGRWSCRVSVEPKDERQLTENLCLTITPGSIILQL